MGASMPADEPHDAPQSRRVTVTHADHGWEVREEREGEVVRRVTYTDWHRVERALQVFDLGLSSAAHSTNR